VLFAREGADVAVLHLAEERDARETNGGAATRVCSRVDEHSGTCRAMAGAPNPDFATRC